MDACDYRPWIDDLKAYMTPRMQAFQRNKAQFLEGNDNGSVPL